ncbi:hypothetical protein [Pseudomonas lurida]|uniref:hypothetical protein n=1 Tax=Pseudomonas lurida TaxID=244566 RepID=UPI001F1BA4F6|nr:hypothetical protein [Pseudomonas lurida]MCF5025132.1 hypothetical protein [Pseudomonas lurida]MCF5308309.1 hypothetical protein [Pseudomonas lurida]MCF5327419.1 hypothetical protein [Pseudomonas lurida]
MDIFLASGGSAALFTLVLWLARNLIITRLTKSVESEYATLLESYKFDLRKSEESFKADLKVKEIEIAALRSGTLSAISNRQLLLDKKRMEASEEIWASVVSLGAFKFVSSWMSVLKFEEAAEAAKHDPNVRRLVEVLDKQIDPEFLKSQLVPTKARPFVTPMLWASYSAYSSVMMQAVMRAFVIKHGVGGKMIKEEKTSEILKLVLPHQTDYIDKFGASCYHYLLEELEEKIIKEIHHTISGASTDEQGIQQAAAVIKKCNEISVPV